MFVETINPIGVLPIHPTDGGGATINGIFDPYNPEWTEWDYNTDFGTNPKFWGDSTSYFGDYGNYSNSFDVFDGYSGVDSGQTTAATAPHQPSSSSSSNSYFVYSQSTGIMVKVVEGESTTISTTGYSGAPGYVNQAAYESLGFKGPLPQGEYQITQVDNHRGDKTIDLSPSSDNVMFGRNNFLIHGDNGKNNFSASEWCIILDNAARTAIINSGITKVIVTR